ncbi:TetR/AcrR family transcriptional regulator [Bailinhaonella thermotolerans]|uniref:TetR/AcrR family transcriptional regulator n=1 Tax=Bailinhaonella thermotolerans TaxID=1070861 RepID=A0A3A4B3W2_9ACTN|nr:TetR/AcrR family transcriptional regulator [Bailinhaonella thermotolerans]RJL32709.1 TetR/AcrR family transcriptional regulator [Bailinhaonella thermotolerans]
MAEDEWGDAPPPSMAPEVPARELPVTKRGVRTREALVRAARAVFERQGYLDAKLTDITREANCSTGSFYTYFTNKEEIFAAVLREAQEDMMHPGMGRVPGDGDPYAVLEAANRAYLEAYRRNARLMALLEQVSHIDPAFRRLRRARADAFIRRNARGIADLQARGAADPALDPLLTSRALSGMVSRVAYTAFADEDADPIDFDTLVTTLTRLWANALRFPPRP